MANADPRIRQLTIKTGVLKRISKEKVMYTKEAEELEAKVEKMRGDGKDEHDIKKQMEVCEESRAMIPDAKRRLQTAYNDLKNLVDTETDLQESKEYQAATAMLKETNLDS